MATLFFFFFFFFFDRLGGRIPVLQDIWPGLTYSKQEIVLLCVSVIMGDHSHHVIAVYPLYVSQGTPVCYNKILDVSIVTESKNMDNYKSVLFLPEKEKNKKQKAEKAQRKREIRLPQITHQLRDINFWYDIFSVFTHTGLHNYSYWPRYDFFAKLGL